MIKGFVSDMDGIVADTEVLHYKAFQRFTKTFGVNLSEEEYAKGIGIGEEEHARMIKRDFKIPLPLEEILKEIKRLDLEELGKVENLNEGYVDLLELLKKNGTEISLATSSSRPVIDIIMGRTEIGKYFVSTFSAHETGSKVLAYAGAVKSLGLKASECFALEDSPHGGMAAKQAGLYCVVIPSKYVNGADFSFADEVHKSIPEFLRKGKILKGLAAK